MICPKCGNDMGTSVYCNNCNTYPFKEKAPIEWKKTFKITGIAIGCFVIFMGILVGIIELGEKREYNKTVNAQYEEIYQEFLDDDYYSALSLMKDFQNDYDDNKKMMTKASKLSKEIESELYNKIKSTDMAISECNTYLEFYPQGQYVSEVKESLTVYQEKQAIQDISEAKKAIQNKDFLEADSILQSIINDTTISEDTKKQAREVLNPIAGQVNAEKGKAAILGTWKKATGVTYTFEEDGHMSVSMSSNYNSSAGTTGDGMEVLSILSEIEDFSRIVRGGTWRYLGTEESDSGPLYAYSLFYQSSQHICYISAKDGTPLGICLASGLGDMSFLTK